MRATVRRGGLVFLGGVLLRGRMDVQRIVWGDGGGCGASGFEIIGPEHNHPRNRRADQGHQKPDPRPSIVLPGHAGDAKRRDQPRHHERRQQRDHEIAFAWTVIPLCRHSGMVAFRPAAHKAASTGPLVALAVREFWSIPRLGEGNSWPADGLGYNARVPPSRTARAAGKHGMNYETFEPNDNWMLFDALGRLAGRLRFQLPGRAE